MSNQFEIRVEDMPAEMRSLLDDYPRDSWDSHAGFKEKTRQWLGAHQMFRRVSAKVRQDAEGFLDNKETADQYARQLSYSGSALIGNLHGHHSWEDHSYFPELSMADPRFNAGIEILENDHLMLNEVLDEFATSANRALGMIQHNDTQVHSEVGALRNTAETIEDFLQRHLSDEEELAVPIILHHRLRG